MRPNLRTHKKRHGTFFYPGDSGFRFNFGSLVDNVTKHSSAWTVSVFLLAAIIFSIGATALNPIFGMFGALAYISYAYFAPKEKGMAGNAPTPEELTKQLKAQSDLAIKEAIEKFKTTDPLYLGLTKMKEDIAKLAPDNAEAAKTAAEKLRADIDELGAKILAMKEDPTAKFKKGTIAATLALHKSKIDEFISKKSGTLEIEHKATETSTDIDGRENFFTWHEGGRVGQIPVRKIFMRELFKTVATQNEYVKYMDQETVVRDASNVALCGATTSNTKVTWKVRDLKVDKVRDFCYICLDMLNDYTFVQGEIENLLNASLQLKIDNDLLLGTGISPILIGIDSVASTFNAAASGADYSASVTAPNLIDLVSIAGAQIKAFGMQNAYMPNGVLMNPKDVQGMKFLKDNVNNYIKNNQLFSSVFVDNSGKYYIDGMLLIENPLVPENEFYIGDFNKGTIYTRPGVGIEFSYENKDNFETETVTVKVYERLNLLIRNVDKNAFMHCDDIEAALVAITKV